MDLTGLIEIVKGVDGFLDFVLTLLLLMTGVWAIVGANHQARRLRAQGLRDMVRILYLREVAILLRDGIEPPGLDTVSRADDVRSQVPTEVWQDGETARRVGFIYDMTFMPTATVVEQLEVLGADYWLRRINRSERLIGAPWFTQVYIQRAFRRWQLLRYGLESLKSEEFRHRLASSNVGIELRARKAWLARGLASWDELVTYLWDQFETIGRASSQAFARDSIAWSVAVGFSLAIFLNVDSFDLLNSYLTDPGVRQQALDGSDVILAQEGPAAAMDTATIAAPMRQRLDAASTQLANAARELSGTLETLRANVTGEGAAVVKNVAAQLERVAVQVRDVQSGVNDLETDVTFAEQRIRGVTRSLTANFPIGWKRFPNCSAIDSPDVRCQGRTFARPAYDSVAPATGLAAPFAGPTRWSGVLMSAQAADPVAFNQWVAGVIFTGLLLGFGTPRLVHTASHSFRRRLKRKDNAKSGE